ncbi:MAG TPA: hypothetical protein VNC78_05240 [Actinomycetota bacterium]|nr:hypothetical protein [Actinomycetota bacterium]
MTADVALTAATGLVIGWSCAQALLVVRLKAPPASAMRINHRGVKVPVVGGGPLVMGAFIALSVLNLMAAAGWEPAASRRVGSAIALVMLVMYLAGWWDDRRGDERPKGFSGHFGALGKGRVTGGLVKAGAGAVAGGAAGLLLADTLLEGVGMALCVALAANLINLLDRAPGRAGKATLLCAVPLVALAGASWVVAASGLLGALIGVLRYDLAERVMIGDAGANPLGAVLGLGVLTVVDGAGLAIAITVLGLLNLASEKWSFSAAIESNRVLRWLDRSGRSNPAGDDAPDA